MSNVVLPGLRLVRSAAADGFTNMAVDEAILQAHAQGQVPPTLRLYAWQPPAISTGYFQPVRRDVNLEACARAGVDVVRRLTGGRAVLHADEVTYSIVISEALLPEAGVLEAYRILSNGLIAGLRQLGGEARLAPGQRALRGPTGADCFAAAARCDLVVAGEKICGSAQVRRLGVILQHGALPLKLADPSPFWNEPGAPPHATDLARALGRHPSWEEVADALEAGFGEALGAPLTRGELTPAERALAEQLRREKYATEAWNLRR